MKDWLRWLKRWVNSLRGKDIFFHPDISISHSRLGSVYGGWDIDLSKVSSDSIVYSFGIGEDVSFDLALMEKSGVTVHGFDPTPKSIKWVHEQSLPSSFVMHEYGISNEDGVITFYEPPKASYVSYTTEIAEGETRGSVELPVKRLATIMQELDHDRIDILKMDIEGAEYGVVEELVNSDVRPTQLLVEFHHRFKGVGPGATKKAIQQLHDAGYEIFSVAKTGEEFSFLYKNA